MALLRKLKKLRELYDKQVSYQVAGNEWSKPLAFHVLLSQMLRKQNPEDSNRTIPITYLRAGREISIREHLFVCQGSRCLWDQTPVETQRGARELRNLAPSDKVLSYNLAKREAVWADFELINNGLRDCWKITLKDGREVIATANHQFYSWRGNHPVLTQVRLLKKGKELLCRKEDGFTHFVPIASIERAGKLPTLNLKVFPNNNFFLANGILSKNSGKGELMDNTSDVLNALSEQSGWEDVIAHHMDKEPTAQFLSGGNEQITNKGKEKWKAIPAMLAHHSILSWAEGEAIVSPKSSYGDFKHVILSATDDGGKISVCARKDLIKGEGVVYKIPFFRTTCSIIAGSVYKDNFATEILQSGLIQRFLFSYYVPSHEKNLSQIKELVDGLIKEVGEGGEEAKKEFTDYFLDNFGLFDKEPIEWTGAATDRFKDLIDANFKDPEYRGRKLDTYNSFVNSTQKHIEKVASAAAALDDSFLVFNEHIDYAWKVCLPVFQAYNRLLGAKFLPDLSIDEKRRLEFIQELMEKEKGNYISQRDLRRKLLTAKSRGDWDLGDTYTFKFIKEMEKYGALQLARPDGSRKVFYRMKPY